MTTPAHTGRPADGYTSGARRPRVDAVGLLLPESWWMVGLRDDAARRRSVRGPVERQIGRDDSRLSLRADGRIMAVSHIRVDGIPVPATLTMYRVPGAAHDDDGAVELGRLLRESQQPDDQTVIAHGPLGPVLRRVSQRQGDVSVGGADVALLVVDYAVDPDDGHCQMQLNVTSPLLELRDGLVDLFDAIVVSVDPSEDES